jgi:hypothetical protein
MPTTETQAVAMILAELARARKKHPKWPADKIHQAAIVANEAGEMLQAAYDARYEDAPLSDIDTEAVHTAATAIRLLCRG